MTASGYYDTATFLHAYEIGAWRLEIGKLPDGRYAVDHFNTAVGRNTRFYFDTYEEADTYAESWGGRK